jgi:hypothetical protein
MIIRLWERDGVPIEVLERSEAGLARARKHGGRVFDVTVPRPIRKEAEQILARSRRDVAPTAHDAGPVAAARASVVAVDLTPPSAPKED